MFGTLLDSAGYTIEEQYRELQFFALFVAPQLGPAPDESMPWHLVRTPDQTPIDFSWDWRSETHAILRYAFEPIVQKGLHVNTLRSPPEVWLQTLHSQGLIPGLDLEWYNHFASLMIPPGMGHKDFGELFYGRTVPEYGSSVAVDVNKEGKAIKAYFWPNLCANELGISNLECIKRAVRALPASQVEGIQPEPAFEFLEEAEKKWNANVFLFSIDCVNPRDARIKIYVGCPYTSGEFLEDSLSLGGRVPVAEAAALEPLTALWDTFLGDAPDKLTDELAAKSLPGFYLTLGQGGHKSAKVYMSPQHWCATDGEVLGRLRKYFAEQGRSDLMVNRYEAAVRQTLGSAIVDGRCGSHFYVGADVSKGKARMVTYMSPQTYLIEKGRLPPAPPSSSQSADTTGVSEGSQEGGRLAGKEVNGTTNCN